jgi:hypothetical protein
MDTLAVTPAPRNLRELVDLTDKIALDTAVMSKTVAAEYLVQAFGWLGCDLAKACLKIAKDLRGLTDKLEVIDRCLDGMEAVYLLAKASKAVRCEVFVRAAGGEKVTADDINELINWHKETAKANREVKQEAKDLLLHQGILTHSQDNTKVEASISSKLGTLLQEWADAGHTVGDALEALVNNQDTSESPLATTMKSPIPDAEEILACDNWNDFADLMSWDTEGPVNVAVTSRHFALTLSAIEGDELSKKIKTRLEELLRVAYARDDEAFLQSAWIPKTLIAKLLDVKTNGVTPARAIELVEYACSRKDDIFRESIVDRCPDWIKPYLTDPVRLYVSNLAELAQEGMRVKIHFKGQDPNTIRTIGSIDRERQRFTIDLGTGVDTNFTAFHLSFANELK